MIRSFEAAPKPREFLREQDENEFWNSLHFRTLILILESLSSTNALPASP